MLAFAKQTNANDELKYHTINNNIKKHDGKNHYAIYHYVIITLNNEQIKIIKK